MEQEDNDSFFDSLLGPLDDGDCFELHEQDSSRWDDVEGYEEGGTIQNFCLDQDHVPKHFSGTTWTVVSPIPRRTVAPVAGSGFAASAHLKCGKEEEQQSMGSTGMASMMASSTSPPRQTPMWQQKMILPTCTALKRTACGVVASECIPVGSVLVVPENDPNITTSVFAKPPPPDTIFHNKALATLCTDGTVTVTTPARGAPGDRWATLGLLNGLVPSTILLDIGSPVAGTKRLGTHVLVCACSLGWKVVEALGIALGQHRHLLVCLREVPAGSPVTLQRSPVVLGGHTFHQQLCNTRCGAESVPEMSDTVVRLARMVISSKTRPGTRDAYADASFAHCVETIV